MTFAKGQRWISTTESQLGLGIITEHNRRQIHIHFPAAAEERIYAIDTAPLSRIIYREGEEIITDKQIKLRINQVREHQGLILYYCTNEDQKEIQITERDLHSVITLNTPEQRLFSGLLDKTNAFILRIDTLNQLGRLHHSKVRGLLGSRTNHLPHQVYIVSEVARRYAPRVLLADEVGLGKTIEAGMILHYQLVTGRAQRILIVVPETLIHQWLVEMIRRFNLYFSIVDQKRYDGMQDAMDYCEDTDPEETTNSHASFGLNPFETESLVLCSLDFLLAHETARAHALTSTWDIVVVDEAHHLHWSEEGKSPAYRCIETLALQSKGLLLLTATPEQVGIESHFARLHLLDPSRFYSMSEFKKQEQHYQEINQVIQKLMHYELNTPFNAFNEALKTELIQYLPQHSVTDTQSIIKALLDRHGTGRVLFRNTRAAIHGFPERQVNAYPLNPPPLYLKHSAEIDPTLESVESIPLYPETLIEDNSWIDYDPRVAWLGALLKTLYPQKVLVICANARTAMALEQYLKLKQGIRCKAFHEGLSLLERDRAAAFFAEEEQGAQTLVCSEIGSEGRNFQFSHQLVLFDLPLNPDLLEQRIGRLDRIGQKQTINIHVPYLLNTAQDILYHWYHEGIQVFETSCSVGYSLYEHFAERLLPLLKHPQAKETPSQLHALISDTQAHVKHITYLLQAGRDKLLEMNSCDPLKASELIATMEAEEHAHDLEQYMAKVFQEYGIDHDYHSEDSEIIKPGDHMKTSHFPGLKEEGLTVTYSRAKALIRDDIEYLSWEHPMVSDCIEMILSSEIGNATLATISLKTIPPGTVFLETFYTIHCAAPKALQLDTFLPVTPIRILMDASGKNLSTILSYSQLNGLCDPVKRHIGYPLVKQLQEELEKIVQYSTEIAQIQLQDGVNHALSMMQSEIGYEISRLETLQRVNPNIRDEEIDFFRKQIADSAHHLHNTTLKLQAVRVIINNPKTR